MIEEKAKLITEIATAWIQVFALLCGGGFAIHQYLQQDHGEKVKESLNFFDRFNREPIYSARKRVDAAWEKHADEQLRLLSEKSMPEFVFNDFAQSVIETEGIADDVFALSDFFDALEVCIQNDVCDEKVAVTMLQSHGCTLYIQNYAKIKLERKRQNYPLIAANLEKFCQRKNE